MILRDLIGAIAKFARDTWEVMVDEIRNIATDWGVLLFLVGAFGSYPLLYPFIYINELVREVPVAVVDLSNTASSRQLIRMLDATEAVTVSRQLTGLDEAKRDFFAGDISGIMVVPEDFEERILHNQQTSVLAYLDASYFMVYKQVLRGISLASGTMSAGIEIKRLTAKGLSQEAADSARDPLRLSSVALFNPSGGYATYVMIGIMFSLLQQSLLIGIGLLGGTARERDASHYLIPPGFEKKGVLPVLLGKGLPFFLLYGLHAIYIFMIVFKVFDYPMRGSLGLSAFVVFSFLAALIALGFTLASLLRYRETAIPLLLAISLPSVLSAGFSWPIESIPPVLRFLTCFIPGVPGTDAMIRVSQMGAGLHDVSTALTMLWGQVLLYSTCSILIVRRILRRQREGIEM